MKSTGKIALRVGCVFIPLHFISIYHLTEQIDYFNKRRILMEQQKSLLQQANTQAEEAKRK
jgi:hypothetical protein